MTTSDWTVADVSNVSGPDLLARTYIEQRDVRRHVEGYLVDGSCARACDVGAGYGRMTVVLAEFFDEVYAFERDVNLSAIGRRLHPEINFTQVATLGELPVSSSVFDFVLVFTVLQHLTDDEVSPALSEIRRIVKDGAGCLICEQTDESYVTGRVEAGYMFTIGRSISRYEALAHGFALVETSPRVVQPRGEWCDKGHYMLFRAD